MVILRINEYLYVFCIIFQYKFNYNVCLVIGLTCFGNFGKLLIFIYILYHFPCELYCNFYLMIRITGFGNFQNKYIVICILYQFLMWIQLWWWKNCICRSAIDTTLMNFLMTRNTITLAPINIQVIHISGYILVVTWFDQTIVVHTICYVL